MDSLISEQMWYLQSSARDDQESINDFKVYNINRLVTVNPNQKLCIRLISFNGINSFYNISYENNVFYINGNPKNLSVGFYTNFTDICTNIKNTLGILTVTTQAFTNRGVWTFASGTPFTIQFPFGRNSHALMGLPFNFGNPYTITPTLVSGVWTYVTPSPMVYNYLQNINLRADFPNTQNITYSNREGNDGNLDHSQIFAKIPLNADPYQNFWFNVQDTEQYVSITTGTGTPLNQVNFKLVDDFQNPLQSDYDWEAVFKIEVYQDILIPTLNKGMGTNQNDDSSYLKAGGDINGTLQDFVNHFRGAFDNGDTHSGNGSVFKDGKNSVITQIRDGINKSADKLNEISGHIGVGGQIPIVMGTSAGAIVAAIGGAAVTTLGGMEAAAATTVGGMEAAAASTIAGMETAATGISGAITTAIETATAELVAVGEQEVAAEEELVAVEEQKVASKAKTWAETIKDTAAQFKEIVTAVKYVEDIALETKNAVKSLDDLGKDMVGIKDDAQKAAEAAAAAAKIAHDEYRTDVSDFKQKFDNLVDKLDLENIDLSKLDIDLSKLDIDLSKLDIDLGELKNITAAIENKEIDMSPISDELEKISTTMDESRDIFSNVAVTIDESRDILSNVAVTIDESHVLLSNVSTTVVDIFKKDMNIFDNIGKNFMQLVKHLTGQKGGKESYTTQIDELKKFIEEYKEKNIKPEVKSWISENKDIKYDPETSDKTSYNKLISTAVSLESKIKYEPLESWIEKHREKA